jgi:hypothetical protein
VMVNARPTPRVCVCAAERTGTYRAFLLGAIATLAGVADGFGAAPRAATGTSASVLRGAAACARAGPGVGRVSGHWGHCTRCEVVAARGSAAGAEGVAEEEDEEEDGERGPHGYVSILRSAVLRGCNVTLMARVHGNYKKRKLNIEHIVPRSVILSAGSPLPILLRPPEGADACDDLYNMFLCVPTINRARRDYKFCAAPNFGFDSKHRPTVIYGKLNSKARKFSEHARDVWWSLGNGLFVNDRKARFVPREEDRGLIGRAILHMSDTWGCDPDAVLEGGRTTAEQWHRDYPADERELAHIRHVSPLMSYPHSIFHERRAGGFFCLRPAYGVERED